MKCVKITWHMIQFLALKENHALNAYMSDKVAIWLCFHCCPLEKNTPWWKTSSCRWINLGKKCKMHLKHSIRKYLHAKYGNCLWIQQRNRSLKYTLTWIHSWLYKHVKLSPIETSSFNRATSVIFCYLQIRIYLCLQLLLLEVLFTNTTFSLTVAQRVDSANLLSLAW